MLKPLLLNTYDLKGGAAIATYRLHQGLRRIGVASTLLVQQKSSDNPDVLGPDSRTAQILGSVRGRIDRLPVRRYPKAAGHSFSPAMVPDSVAARMRPIDHDLVHMFWITDGFIRLETIGKLDKPLVWTLHDMWPLTGGCHYDDGCGRYASTCGECPLLGSSRSTDLSKAVLRRKQLAWRDVDLTIVATSRWLAECARQSSLFGNRRIEVLPNGIDESRYKPLDRIEARRAFNLPIDKKLILFSAFGATSDARKGFQYLLPALQEIAPYHRHQTELVIIGATEPANPPDLGMKAHYMGYLKDDISQVLLYSAADVTVLPSVQENLSNTIMESLACGTPCVAFDIGGMPDLITHRHDGYLAKPFSVEDLSAGIAWVLADDDRRRALSANAREGAVRRYALAGVAGQYEALYRDIVQ